MKRLFQPDGGSATGQQPFSPPASGLANPAASNPSAEHHREEISGGRERVSKALRTVQAVVPAPVTTRQLLHNYSPILKNPRAVDLCLSPRVHSILLLQTRPYPGAHLHPDSPRSHQNRRVFRVSSDASRWALRA